jgi:hypothetical protein
VNAARALGSAKVSSATIDGYDEEGVLMASDRDSASTVRAPEFPTSLEWINTRPLTMADLRGKLVLLDFWTYG